MKKNAVITCRIMPGGALNVLYDLIQPYVKDDIEIFSYFSDRNYIEVSGKKILIHTALPSWLNKLFVNPPKGVFGKLFGWLLDYRNWMPFYPLLNLILSFKIWLYKPAFALISSFAVSKNIILSNNVQTLLYMHCPMQYIRENYEEYIRKFTGRKLWLFKFASVYLRLRDRKYRKYYSILANSKYTALKCREIYGRTEDIIISYPKLDPKYLSDNGVYQTLDYFVFVGRVVKFVREVDKIIRLFNETSEKLVIIGTGPDEEYLKSIAGDNILFVGWVGDVSQKIQIVAQSRGLINIAKESFGLNTLEALALGVPVFGYSQGGSLELVDDDCGVLVPNKQHATLLKFFHIFCSRNYDKKLIRSKALKMQ